MKKYFSYPFNEKVKKDLIDYYEDVSLQQHSDNQKEKINIKLSRINKLIDFSREDEILDIGCSGGFFLVAIKDKIKRGVGIDISKQIIKKNKKKYFRNLEFHEFNGENINFKQKFDKIFIIDVLEHVFSPDILIRSAYKSLKNKGKLILEIPFTGWLSELVTKKYHQGHLRYYDPKYLKKYLEKNNFKVKYIKIYNSVPFAGFFLKIKYLWIFLNFIINLIPNKIYPYFGEIILIAEKNYEK